MYKFIKLFTLVLLIFVFPSCLSSRMQFPLKIENASSQTWDAGAKHRGTRLEAVLVGKMEHVKIIGLVFRNKRTIPMIKRIDGKLFIKADFEYGTENKLDKSIPTDKVDMIIYSHKGKVYELPLEDIHPKSMKYYPKQ
ncbi:hypothetical protein [Ancylomarina sp. 16SWW S1-10-2]|uniref:hypothetical protein n=1 Tax=Ancylomarina sp. 16SWW S1-10-2 TaxID=2499681 RepID=UPI0012ADBB82|nr:hypothetical protein [Ancylomarina sp. 16SWW S1-10-2]MRT94498.1 hypothetical protein [Ancylomarina sp. 16SWW S1-10-2]